MLDLSKPLGQIDGISLFRDHELEDLIYYLPDEIDLRLLALDRPDIALQIFFTDEAITGGVAELEKAVGSILSLGVHCLLSPSRFELVRSTLASRLGRDDLRLTPPPWEDGNIQLLLLDTQSGDGVAARENDQMTLGVVGSRKPSLSDGQLSGLFHARLDRRGTALVAAAINGQIGSVAGVLYDLSFAALRPVVNLRMSANLDRCAEFIKIGAGVQIYYVSADVTAMFGKMREEGIIHVDLVSEEADRESELLVNESVNDFYDVLMRELFKPTVSPAEAIGAAGMAGATAQTSIVKLTFAYTRVEHERIVEVDYRKRSAVRRTHNPQAHLRRLAELVGGAEKVIQRVPLSAAWREFEVEIAAPSAFADISLRQVRVVLWRGRDDVLNPTQARDGGLRMPSDAVALADLAFSKDDTNPRRLVFVTQPDEPPFYRWQARMTYAQADNVDSPAEIWSEPHESSSADLDLFPENLAPQRQVILKMGVGHNLEPRSVEAHLVARDATGKLMVERRLAVDASHPESRWSIRRGEVDQFTTEATLMYRYPGSASLSRPAQTLLDRELIANDPFIRTVVLAPLAVGAPADLLEIVLVVRYQDVPSGFQSEAVRHLRSPEFRGDDVEIPVINVNDRVSWEATAVRANGQTTLVGRGESPGGVMTLQFSATRRIRVEWLGPAPVDLGLRWLRAMFRTRQDDGQILESMTIEWRGTEIEGEKIVTLPSQGSAEWSIERRFEDGRKETTPFVAVDSDLLAVQG